MERGVTGGAAGVVSGRSGADSGWVSIDVAAEAAAVEAQPDYVTTQMPCVVCLTTMSLDDEQPKLGTVGWRVAPYFGLRRGTAISFRCPQGHCSEDDPDLLRAFPSRLLRAFPSRTF